MGDCFDADVSDTTIPVRAVGTPVRDDRWHFTVTIDNDLRQRVRRMGANMGATPNRTTPPR